MRKMILIPLLFIIIGVALIGLYRWDSENNHGFEFGYYGDFNRVSNAMATVPGVTITQAWANCDVTLEEFGFTATNRAGQTIRIAVGERDYIRHLSGTQLLHALKQEIEAQVTSSQTNR